MTTKLAPSADRATREWGKTCFWACWILECDFEWMALRFNPRSKRLGYVTEQSDGTAVLSA